MLIVLMHFFFCRPYPFVLLLTQNHSNPYIALIIELSVIIESYFLPQTIWTNLNSPQQKISIPRSHLTVHIWISFSLGKMKVAASHLTIHNAFIQCIPTFILQFCLHLYINWSYPRNLMDSKLFSEAAVSIPLFSVSVLITLTPDIPN